jgi:hypothetical protein
LSAIAALVAGLPGCILFGACGDDTHTCGVATIQLPALDPGLAGTVALTISRQDLPSEAVTCHWQAETSGDAGAPAAGWSCDPAPDATDSQSVTYNNLLVKETAYQLVLVGPSGTTTIPIAQGLAIPGDSCNCVRGNFQIPDSAWMQVGAL